MNGISKLGDGWTAHEVNSREPGAHPIFAEMIYGQSVLRPSSSCGRYGCIVPVSLAIKDGNLIVCHDERGYRHSHPEFLYPRTFVPLFIASVLCIAAVVLYVRQYFPYGSLPLLPGDVLPNVILGLSLFVLLPLAIAHIYFLKSDSARSFKFERPWQLCNPLWFADPDCEILAIRPGGKKSDPVMFLLPKKSQRLRDWPLMPMIPLASGDSMWRLYRTSEKFMPITPAGWLRWWVSLAVLIAALLVGPELSLGLSDGLARASGLGITAFVMILAIGVIYPGYAEIRLRWADGSSVAAAAKWIRRLPVD